jgi:serine protease inhibitor
MQYLRFSLFLILLVTLVITTSGATNQTNTTGARVAEANTKFGWKLLSQIKQASGSQNFLFSPASIGWCLAMVQNGARGSTLDEIAAALETKGFYSKELNEAYAEWKKSWNAIDPKVQLEIANSIWARKGIALKPDFVAMNKNYFDAEVAELDFNNPSALTTINGWVKTKTRNKIDKIVDEISPDSVIFLINAIYFNGKWTKAFDATKTKEEDFTTGSGSRKKTPMMHQRGEYQYLEQDEFQAVRLPYGNKRLSMDIFLPSEKIGLQKFLDLVATDEWNQWAADFSESEGEIAIPRFRVEYEITLNDALKSLGMKSAFDPQHADFGAMVSSTAKTYISSVKHKAFAEVNEEGTEAAAVTSTEIRVTSMPIARKPFQMIVNRPFFFVIRDSSTNAVLFAGAIISP